MMVEGWVVIRSPTASLRKPAAAVVPGAPLSEDLGIGVVDAEGLWLGTPWVSNGGTKAEVVDVCVLAELLDQMY
jgi:hypothetical protein